MILADAKKRELESLLPYATAKRRGYIEAWIELGSSKEAGDRYGVSGRTVRSAVDKLRRYAAKRGWHPDERLVAELADGFHVKRHSQFQRRNKETGEWEDANRWLISEPDKEEQFHRLREAMQDVAADYEGFGEPVPSARCEEANNPDLLNVVPIGDLHFGMLAWHEEVGNNYDLDIASKNLQIAFDQLMFASPPAATCQIINLGDLFHADNVQATTAKGTRLDVDSRRNRMLRETLKAIVYIVERATRFHSKVRFVSEIGNHDTNTAAMVPMYIDAWFRNDPRVEVDLAPTSAHYYKHGQCLIASTHGDKANQNRLGPMMAVDCKEWWGQTTYRHWYTGHVHHKTVTDYPGCTVETARVLPPADAWHHDSGYRSMRTLQLDTWHSEFGLEDQKVIGIKRIRSLGGE